MHEITQPDAWWNLARLTSESPPEPALDPTYVYDGDACGQGVLINVFDSPVQATHHEFNKSLTNAEDKRIQTYRAPRALASDSHGTSVASVAAGLKCGVAKGATIVSLTDGVMTNAMSRMLQRGMRPAILNMSNVYGPGEAETRNMIEIIKSGVHVVISAGNSNEVVAFEDKWALAGINDEDKEHLKSILWVGASTQDDAKWEGSSYGPIIDLFAPGSNVKIATTKREDGPRNQTFGYDNGTSLAAPHVAGIIACLLSHPQYRNYTPKRMKQKILAMALPNAIKGVTESELKTNYLNQLKVDLEKDLQLVLYQQATKLPPDVPIQPTELEALQASLQEGFIATSESSKLAEQYIPGLLADLQFMKKQEIEVIESDVSDWIDDDLTLVTERCRSLTWDDLAPVDLTTTSLLASCRLDRWNLGDEEPEAM